MSDSDHKNDDPPDEEGQDTSQDSQDDSQNDASSDDQNSGSSGEDSSDGSGDGSGDGDSGSDKGKNWLEWTITAAGAALVLFVVGFLIYEWASSSGEPADLQVTLGVPTVDGSLVEIPVEVRNEGAKVAEAAVIEVCAGPDSCGQVTFDYIPFKSTVSGTVGLEAPLEAEPSSRVVSYRNP